MRRSTSLLALGLFALCLSGCDEKKDIIRLGMLNAPFAYLAALSVLVALRALWKWRNEDSLLRTGVMLIPFFGLSIVAILSMTALRTDQKEFSDVLVGAMVLSPVIFPILAGALCVPMLLIWRLWFALSPRESFEGAALVSAAVFFAPGFFGLFGAPLTGDFITALSMMAFLMANGSIPLALILIIEAYIMKGREQKPSA